MQSPSAEPTDNERRARLLELEERQRRLQQLCEEALRGDEAHQRAMEQLEIHNSSDNALAAPPPPPRLPFSQSPDRPFSYSFTQRGERGMAPPPFSSHTSRGGGGATATYQEDLMTGEVQSFRDPNSVARGSSVNTIRDPSQPQPSQQPPPPPPAAAGARPVFTLHDTRGGTSRQPQGRIPSPRNTPTLSPRDEEHSPYVQDRLHVGSGERGYRRFPSSGMVDTPVYPSDQGRDDVNGASGLPSASRGPDDLFGSARKSGPPPPPPPPPPPSQGYRRTAPTGYARGAHAPPPPPPAAVRLPPPSPSEDEDTEAAVPVTRARAPLLTPPTASNTAAAAGASSARSAKEGREVPTTVSGRRRALRERYGLKSATGDRKRTHSTGSATPPPPPPPPPPAAGATHSPAPVSSPPPPPPPPVHAATTAGLFDDTHKDSEREGGARGWRDRLRRDIARQHRRPGPRGGPPPPPTKEDDGDVDSRADPWERHSITPSMMSTEERELDDFFRSPWRHDKAPSDRWRRGKDALNAPVTGRAALTQQGLRSRRPRPPPPPGHETVDEGPFTSMDDSASHLSSLPPPPPPPPPPAAAEATEQRRPSYPNASRHPYGGGSAAPRKITSGSSGESGSRGRHPTAHPSKPPLSHINGNRSAAAVKPPSISSLRASTNHGGGYRTQPRGGNSGASSATPHRPDDLSSIVSGVTGRAQSGFPVQHQHQQPHGEADAASFFDEDPGKAALRDLLQRPPLVPTPQQASQPQQSQQQQQQGSRARSPSIKPIPGAVGAGNSHSYFVAPPPLAAPQGSVEESSNVLQRSKNSGAATPVPPLPTATAQVEMQEAKAKAEALARHLVKAMKDRKMLQENVEQLELLVEESNFEVGRLQRVVEEQHGESNESLGLQAALRAKEREIAVCEDEIKRLSNIVDAHVLRLSAAGAGEENEEGGHPSRCDVVVHAAEMEAAMTEIGVAHLAQREAEERAEQLSSELETAVEQIRALDERLAEMERAAAAERLREVRSGLRAGSTRPSSDPRQTLQPQPQSTSLSLPLPSVEETERWPLSARRALAKVISQAEGLLVQNSESSRHASTRLQHLEYSCEELQRRLEEKKRALHGLQDECVNLRKEKNAIRMVGDQWFKQLQEVKADAHLVSELVRTSREDAEDVVVASQTAGVHLDNMARASSSPFALASPPSPASVAALHERNEQAKGFAQQVMRDMHSIARFLGALREMDIGEQTGYKILQSLASGERPADKLYLTADDGSHSPKMVQAIATGHDAIAARVREKRDFVIRAVEHALDGEPLRDLPPARRLELRRDSAELKGNARPSRGSSSSAGGEEARWDPDSRPDEWQGDYPHENRGQERGEVAASEVSVEPDGFEADLESADVTEVDMSLRAMPHPMHDSRGLSSRTARPPATSHNAGLVASDFRGGRAVSVTQPPSSDEAAAPSQPMAAATAAAAPLTSFPPPQQQRQQQQQSRSWGDSQGRGDEDVAPVARPLRLSSTPPERAVEADIPGGGATDTSRNAREKGRRAAAADEREDATFISSPSLSPPTHDRPVTGNDPKKRPDAAAPSALSSGSSERRRLQLSSPSRDREDALEARSPTPPALGQDPLQRQDAKPASTSATMMVSPDTERRTPTARLAVSPGEEEDDDDSPHLARATEVTKAFDSQRQSAGSDALHRSKEVEKEEISAKRSSSPPAAPVPPEEAVGARRSAPSLVTEDSPPKSKSASVDGPPPALPAERPSQRVSSLPQERSTTAPPSSNHRRHKSEAAHDKPSSAGACRGSDSGARPSAPHRSRGHSGNSSGSDSDYDEATLSFMGGAPRGPNVVQEVRVAPEPVVEPVKPRSAFNRIAALEEPSQQQRGREAESAKVVAASPNLKPPPPMPTHTPTPSDGEFEEEEVSNLEERREAPPPPAPQQASQPGRPMPREDPSTVTLDNLDNISSINDSGHGGTSGDPQPSRPQPPHDANSYISQSSIGGGSLHRPPTPLGDAAGAGGGAAPPLPPRLQRSVPQPSGPTSGNTSGRETPLERPSHAPPPQQQRRPSPNPSAPTGMESTLPPSLPQPQPPSDSLPRPGGPSSRSATPLGASLAPNEPASLAATAAVEEPPEVPSTAMPSSRLVRSIQSPDRRDKSSSSSSGGNESGLTGEHSTAFTGLNDTQTTSGIAEATARPEAKAAHEPPSRGSGGDGGGLGLPSAPASSADAILMLDPTNLPQPAAPLPAEPQAQLDGAGGANHRLPPRAGGRLQRQTTPEVASLPRVNLDDADGSTATSTDPKEETGEGPKTLSAPRLVRLTTRGRSASADSKEGHPRSHAPSQQTSSLLGRHTPPAGTSASMPPAVSRADSGTSTPGSSFIAGGGGGSRLYDAEAMQKRKDDVAKILQRLKEKKNHSRSGSESARASATPSPSPPPQ